MHYNAQQSRTDPHKIPTVGFRGTLLIFTDIGELCTKKAIDETVFEHLRKSKDGVKVYILTQNISSQLILDLKKYNAQYPKIEVVSFSLAHNRFLIIDEKDIYHIGTSLKDLGKKWVALHQTR